VRAKGAGVVNNPRLATALADVKCGAAAIDDALALFREVLEEGPDIGVRHRVVLENSCAVLSKFVGRADTVIGAVTRILEEGDRGIA
jgi:hypothetical protein